MNFTLHCPEAKRVYQPAGICIYCGRTEDILPLRIEHIFTKGLGGNLELPKSSCDDCGAITGSIEQKLLRGPFWPIRARIGVHSGRRPEQQPDAFDVEYWRHEERIFASVPVEQMTVNLIMPGMKAPGLLADGHWDEHYERTTLEVISFDDGGFDEAGQVRQRYQKSGTTGVTLGAAVDLMLFRRLIAKIAHGYVYAELGGSFRPYLTEFIRGSDMRAAGQFVGAMNVSHLKSEFTRHGVGMFFHDHGQRQLIVGAVAIFTPIIGRVYLAVVGERPRDPA